MTGNAHRSDPREGNGREMESLLASMDPSDNTKNGGKQKYQSFQELADSPLGVARQLQLRRDFETGSASAFPAAPSKLPYSVYAALMAFFDENTTKACALVSKSMNRMLAMRENECADYSIDPEAVVSSMRTSHIRPISSNTESHLKRYTSAEEDFPLGDALQDEPVALTVEDETCQEDTCQQPDDALGATTMNRQTIYGIATVLALLDVLLFFAVEQWALKALTLLLAATGVYGFIMWLPEGVTGGCTGTGDRRCYPCDVGDIGLDLATRMQEGRGTTSHANLPPEEAV